MIQKRLVKYKAVKKAIKQKLSIQQVVGEYVSLNQRGQNLWGICPFHDDTSPSMSVSLTKQIFKCFACGTGGDIFTFVEKYHKTDFKEALYLLGKKANVTLQLKPERTYSVRQTKSLEILAEANKFFQVVHSICK